jgi:hypothetical protein
VDAHGGVEEQLQQDFMLDIPAVLDHPEEAFECRVWQQARQLVLGVGAAEFQLPPGLLAQVEKAGVVEVGAAGGTDHYGDGGGFRNLVCGYAITPVFGPRGHGKGSLAGQNFAFSSFCEMVE